MLFALLLACSEQAAETPAVEAPKAEAAASVETVQTSNDLQGTAAVSGEGSQATVTTDAAGTTATTAAAPVTTTTTPAATTK